MMRRVLAVLGLALVACEDPPKVAQKPDVFRPPIMDATVRDDAVAPQPDAATDGPLSDANDFDGGDAGDAGDAGDMGDAGDAADAADAAPLITITREQVAVAASADRAFVVWAAGTTVFSQVLDPGGPEGPPIARSVRNTPATNVAATVAGNALWMVSGDPDVAEVARADALDVAPVRLDVRPPFLATPLGDGLVVFGIAEGVLSWQTVQDGDPPVVGALQQDRRITVVPSSAAASEIGTVVRFEESGQCLLFDDDAVAIGNFVCLASPGAMVSEGVRPVLVADFDRRSGIRQVGASPVFDYRSVSPYPIGNFIMGAPRYVPHGGTYPVIAERVEPGEAQGLTQLYGVRGNALWESDETWNAWPYSDSLAIAMIEEAAYVVDFSPTGDPMFARLGLTLRDFGAGRPLRLPPPDNTCALALEVCDDEGDAAARDQDCDGVADNGLCCLRASPPPSDFEPGGQPQEVLVGAKLGGERGFRFAMQVADSFWDFFELQISGDRTVRRVDDCRFSNCLTGWSCGLGTHGREVCLQNEGDLEYRESSVRGAGEGLAIHALGGYTALIARGENNGWHVWWHHPSRGLVDLADPSPKAEPQPIPCETVLMTDVINNTADNASLIIVCPDRFVRMYGDTGRVDETFRFVDLDIDTAEWATTTRPSSAQDTIRVLLGSERGGRRDLKSFTFAADPALGPRQAALPPALAGSVRAQDPQLAWPIWLHRLDADRPAVVLPTPIGVDTPPAALVDSIEGAAWSSVIGSTLPSRYAYAKGAVRVVVSEEHVERTDFWVTSVTDDEGVSLWSQAPTLGFSPPVTFWDVAATDYSEFLIALTDLNNGTWRVETRQVGCRGPGLRSQP